MASMVSTPSLRRTKHHCTVILPQYRGLAGCVGVAGFGLAAAAVALWRGAHGGVGGRHACGRWPVKYSRGQFAQGGRTNTVHPSGIQIASFLRCNKRTGGIINTMVADNEQLAAVGINDWSLQNQSSATPSA